MKKHRLLLFLLLSIFGIHQSPAQDCSMPEASKLLSGNNISANILNGGDLFWDRSNAQFSVPNNQFPSPSTIFTSGLWMGGFVDNVDLKLSAVSYNSPNNFDYTAGPINTDINGQMSFDCENFDRMWEVRGWEIEQHLADFQDNGVIDQPIENIFGYPAKQNPFFEGIYGFSLPDTPNGLAPFFDENEDGIYNPEDGDFPLPNNVDKNVIPSHLVWGIFNDMGGSGNVFSEPLGIEVQLTAWAFSCNDNEVLNNTIFTSHKFVNRSTSFIDSMFVGYFTDMDLGCFDDDFVGCAPNLDTYFAYNQNPVDGNGGTCFGVPTFDNNPPAQAVTFLNREMHSFVIVSNPGVGAPNICTGQTNTPSEYYNVLSGFFPSSQPMTIGGNGCGGNIPTKFIFPDNPNK